MENQIFYHFMSAKWAICDLQEKRIKVSTFGAINDLYELMPYRRYDTAGRRPYNAVYESISKKYGLLCFSPSWVDKQLLWAHYADIHKGIALGLEILKYDIQEVTYPEDERRPQIVLTEDQEKNERKFLEELFYKKYKDWKYEDEFRIKVKLDECDHDQDIDRYFIKFGDKIALKEIVLGARFDHNENQGTIFKLAKELGVKVIATRSSWGYYEVHQDGAKTPKYNWRWLIWPPEQEDKVPEVFRPGNHVNILYPDIQSESCPACGFTVKWVILNECFSTWNESVRNEINGKLQKQQENGACPTHLRPNNFV